LEEVQARPARFVAVLPSLNVPTAVSWIAVLRWIFGLLGDTVIAVRVTGDTVNEADPLTAPTKAEIVAVPLAIAVTTPRASTVAARWFDELQTAERVTSWVLESLNVPTAFMCRNVPVGSVRLAGVTAIDTRVAGVTVTGALPVTDPEVALTVAAPVPTAVATPVAGSTASVWLSEEPQVTVVNTCVLPSSKVPVAVNCCAVPRASDTGEGVTEIETSRVGTTVKVAVPLNAPTVAVMVVVPAASVSATPELSMVATLLADELQVTPAARSCAEPSL
jgi:hypothetical protein